MAGADPRRQRRRRSGQRRSALDSTEEDVANNAGLIVSLEIRAKDRSDQVQRIEAETCRLKDLQCAELQQLDAEVGALKKCNDELNRVLARLNDTAVFKR